MKIGDWVTALELTVSPDNHCYFGGLRPVHGRVISHDESGCVIARTGVWGKQKLTIIKGRNLVFQNNALASEFLAHLASGKLRLVKEE